MLIGRDLQNILVIVKSNVPNHKVVCYIGAKRKKCVGFLIFAKRHAGITNHKNHLNVYVWGKKKKKVEWGWKKNNFEWTFLPNSGFGNIHVLHVENIK